STWRLDFAVPELYEQGNDRVQHHPFRGQQFPHVQDQLLGRDAFALLVLPLERRHRQLALGGGSHQAINVRVVHLACCLSVSAGVPLCDSAGEPVRRSGSLAGPYDRTTTSSGRSIAASREFTRIFATLLCGL